MHSFVSLKETSWPIILLQQNESTRRGYIFKMILLKIKKVKSNKEKYYLFYNIFIVTIKCVNIKSIMTLKRP